MKYKVGQNVSFDFSGVAGHGTILGTGMWMGKYVYNLHVYYQSKGSPEMLHGMITGTSTGWFTYESGIKGLVGSSFKVLDKILHGGYANGTA